MNKKIGVVEIVLTSVVLAGCSTLSEWYAEQQLKWREAQEREYKRLAELPPAQMVKSPDRDIAACAKQCCDLFNVAQPKMRAYIIKIETSREYVGFINDVQYCIEEEKMSNTEACKKVKDAVVAADANRPDDEKVWPKILKGWEAARQLGPKADELLILELNHRHIATCARMGKIYKKLRKSQKELKNEKNKTAKQERAAELMNRLAECAAIQKQLSDASKCISFMMNQYSRVKELEDSSR